MNNLYVVVYAQYTATFKLLATYNAAGSPWPNNKAPHRIFEASASHTLSINIEHFKCRITTMISSSSDPDPVTSRYDALRSVASKVSTKG